jgi:hypothetical protein
MPGPNAPYTELDSNQVIKQVYDEAGDRLRVDAVVSATIGDVIIDAEESDIAIKDRVTDNLLKINNDGSIDANVVVSASGGDNIAISDGTDTLEINSDGSINVKISDVLAVSGNVSADIEVSASDGDNIAISDGINTLQINSDGSINVQIPNTVAVSGNLSVSAVLSNEPIKASGTIDGSVTGQEFGLVYNLRQQVLASHDRIDTYTYADFGTKNQRITRVDYTSATFSSITVRREFNYVLDGNRYRRTTSPWTVV